MSDDIIVNFIHTYPVMGIIKTIIVLNFNEIRLKEIPSLLFEFLSKGEGTCCR